MFKKPDGKVKERIGYIFIATAFLVSLTLFCISFHYSLLIPLLLIFIGLHLFQIRKANFRIFSHLSLLIFLSVISTHLTNQYATIHHYLLPIAGIAMLAMLLFNDLQLTVIVAFASSMIASIILGDDYTMMMIFLLGSLTGAYAVKDARTRGKLIIAGLLVSGINVVCALLFKPDLKLFLNMGFIEHEIYPLIANGFLAALFVAATLRIFEYIFGVVTNFSLLELADFNHPLLKRLMIEAPGTYHHSMLVSNLSEAAAAAIGANSLLTRVGAYYHDIGKTAHPEYFTENQIMSNKHDELEPTMSRLVILNHIKEGVELAKKYRLNPVIIDFIPQHHGTSLIYYFYRKTIERAQEGEEVPEESFRYPGPKPQSRETAITLLADSVEGATRALDERTPTAIEETVKKVINNKFIDGQLDECNLTLTEINTISSTFTRMLTSMYHNRVKYPEKKNGHHPRKSAEKSSSQPVPDQDNRKKDS
jgi:putative nucleotidyltransferase with HDIG domain